MTKKIVWHDTGQKLYETGTSKGVLYPKTELGVYGAGVPWNGLISMTDAPSGAEPEPQYADNIKYLELMSPEEQGLTIEAFHYPDEWGVCDGSAEPVEGVSIGQQPRRKFGISWVTQVGNEITDAAGYKLHILYEGLAAPSEKAYTTINESPEAITFSWEVTTTPIPVEGFRPSAKLTIDSTKVDSDKLAALEAILYGGDEDARLPLPDEVLTLLGTAG